MGMENREKATRHWYQRGPVGLIRSLLIRNREEKP
jgi:hypothetical protein